MNTSFKTTQSSINSVVTAVISMVATTKKNSRVLNSTYRPALTSMAYALHTRDGEVSDAKLRMSTAGMTVSAIKTRVSQIRHSMAEAKVRDNVRVLQLRAHLQAA